MAAADKILTPYQDVLIPAGGSLTVADTDERTGLYVTTISVNSDTVLATCTGFDENGLPINFLTDERYLWAGTLLAGAIKFAGKDRRIAVVELTSGNVDLGKIRD